MAKDEKQESKPSDQTFIHIRDIWVDGMELRRRKHGKKRFCKDNKKERRSEPSKNEEFTTAKKETVKIRFCESRFGSW